MTLNELLKTRLVTRTLPDGRKVALVEKSIVGCIKSVDKEERSVIVVASDRTLDRMGDTIEPNGWDTTAYRNNPVVLIDHSYTVAGIVGTAVKTWTEDGQLKQKHVFDPPENNAASAMAWAKIASGSLRTVSVGFRAVEYVYRQNDKNELTGGIDFLKQELYETSWVAVPANPSALIDESSRDTAAGESAPVSSERLIELCDRLSAAVFLGRLNGDRRC